jgi:hypothetical protein
VADTASLTPYLAECFWPDVREDEIQSAAVRLAEEAGAADDGSSLVFGGSLLIRQDEVVFFLFRAVSAALVRDVCLRAEVPVERVMEVASTAIPAFTPGWPSPDATVETR